MLVNCSSLRLSKPDKVDNIGEDLDEAIMRRLEQIIEREICDVALLNQLASNRIR